MAGVRIYKTPTPPVLSLSLQTRGEKDLLPASVSFNFFVFVCYLRSILSCVCCSDFIHCEYLIIFKFLGVHIFMCTVCTFPISLSLLHIRRVHGEILVHTGRH